MAGDVYTTLLDVFVKTSNCTEFAVLLGDCRQTSSKTFGAEQTGGIV